MKRLIPLLALIPCVVWAQYHPPIEYGKGATIDFVLYNADGSLATGEEDSGSDVTLDCDGTPTNPITNDFVDEGAFYSIALTAAETECARITLTIAGTDTNVVVVPTFGHPLAHVVSYQPYKAAGLVDDAGTISTLPLAAGDAEADDFYNGYVGKIVAGTGAGQEFIITDYVNTGNVATVTTLVTAPAADSYYIIYAEKRSVVTVDANGNVSADVNLAEGIDWSDHLDSRLAANSGPIDAKVDDIKAKTDSLTFTEVGEVDANVKSFGDVEVCITPGGLVSTVLSGNCE